jgi:hypothetical protein
MAIVIIPKDNKLSEISFFIVKLLTSSFIIFNHYLIH